MEKPKGSKHNLYSAILFIVGLAAGFGVSGQVKNIDKYHWLILLPTLLPITGILFGVFAVFEHRGVNKLIPIALTLINVCLAVVLFINYAFSYWQF